MAGLALRAESPAAPGVPADRTRPEGQVGDMVEEDVRIAESSDSGEVWVAPPGRIDAPRSAPAGRATMVAPVAPERHDPAIFHPPRHFRS